MKTARSIALVLSLAALPALVPGAPAPALPSEPASRLPAAPPPEPSRAPVAEPSQAPAAASARTPAGERTNGSSSAAAAVKETAAPPAKAPPGPPKAPGAGPLSPRFKQIRERINALFEHRNEPPEPPDPRYNPFRPPGAVPVAAGPAANARDPAVAAQIPAPLSSDLALLQQAVATLKVSGTFQIGGRSHLVINAKPYKVGEVIQTKVKGESVFLRVRAISRNSVTLGLNGAEMTLKF